jgi:diadenosine tetraphosphate (Ap4A) HIT family hydrolase
LSIVFNDPRNKYSHLTAMERTNLSAPANFLLKDDRLVGRILDFGCGFGTDVKILADRGLDISGYDPYYRKDIPAGKFDTILCFYVLNVLFPEEQSRVLMSISNLLKPTGKAYFAVRRDLKKEGFREHYVHKKPTYQCRVKLPFKSISKDEFREIYEYQHYNLCRHSEDRCIFCNPRRDLTLLTESATAYAILDGYPVSKGHTLIIPKRHVPNFLDLPIKEQAACWLMVNIAREILDRQFHPDGYNIGININPTAGQKLKHGNIHIIPRYGDNTIVHPGGMRAVIPK